MEKINVLVINSTGSIKRHGELCLNSGIVKFSDGQFEHLSRLDQVREVKVEAAKEPAPAPVIELPSEKLPAVETKKPGRPKKQH